MKMDVYSVFSSSAARRDCSRLDLDLKSIRRISSRATDRPPSERTPSPSQRLPHIGIVGAGIAGLRCADILLQHGFRVTMLEGRHRLGGRLHQARLQPSLSSNDDNEETEGPLVDMGPNWIHGTKDNPILDLVRATETVTSSHDVDEEGNDLGGAVFDVEGTILPLDEGEALSTIMWTIVEEAFVHSNTNCSTIDPGESLYDFFVQRLDAHVTPAGADATEAEREAISRKRKLVLQMADFWGAFVGSPVGRQSLKYYWLEECIEGENLFCAGTYKRVFDRLIEPVVEGATIHYGKTVSRIVSTQDTPNHVPDTLPSSSVTVVTTAGETYSFDEVVCTMPLGWLKKNAASAFEPPIPSRVSEAIASIGYGSLEKVYISFPEAFWQRPDPATGRSVRGFCQWLAPGVYAQPSNPEHWSLEAFDMAALPKSAAHPTLLFYTYGEQSVHIMDTLASLRDEDGSKSTAANEPSEMRRPNTKQTAFLLNYFRPYFGTMPHYDPASPACQPTGIIATNWLHDDLAGNGSYSNFQVGLVRGDEDIRVMREGLPGRGVWLAGEHTSPFVALGTATGAYWSGESVGRRIAEAYGLEQEGAAAMGAAVADETHIPLSSVQEPVALR
ncbi:hypothetical protein SPBR_08270 [Sporothrix brasiliensis 5110]|uniref:Amine oxidase domain-containing protein n=1 Tax=Sporothrix brasiliensis 5110 TaxID=1398154 RepID=A0A0C2INP0_9PEZI|nr:uncharacterized protein SPBR_08270 [Sporothrix brasiliensis 5110]KIH86642.1 hypothetical protein SPBR_08270 [Sporothrix brasiliensis 5110]